MGTWYKDLYGAHQNPVDMKMSSNSNIVVGTIVMREATASNAGDLTIGATTAALNAFGCAIDVGTYSAVQGATEGIVRVSPNPFAVYRFRVSGSSTKGAALSSASGGQILTNTLASTTGLVVTDADAVTDMSGGLIKGRTGANAGVTRKQTSLNSGVDTNVVVPFPNDIAVGDTFIRLPYSNSCIAMQTVATTIDEADGSIAFGTGIPVQVVEVLIDEQNDQAFVYVVLRTHWMNSLA